MSKEYFVLRSGRVVYPPGYCDLDGARATAQRESAQHPRALVYVVHVVDAYTQLQCSHKEPEEVVADRLDD